MSGTLPTVVDAAAPLGAAAGPGRAAGLVAGPSGAAGRGARGGAVACPANTRPNVSRPGAVNYTRDVTLDSHLHLGYSYMHSYTLHTQEALRWCGRGLCTYSQTRSPHSRQGALLDPRAPVRRREATR